MPALLKRIEDARAEGLDVTADQYPWTASSNGLADSLPLWVREGGADKMIARLRDKETARPRTHGFPQGRHGVARVASRILITSVINDDLRKYQGKTLADIAKEEKKDPLDVLMDIVAADRGNTYRVTFSMSEDDVRAALTNPLVSFNTDSSAVAEDGIFAQEKAHPRAWGSATRILGHYVRDEKVLTLEQAIRRMTSLPAARMHLKDRGILKPGMAADLVAFDPATVRERSTFADPSHYSEGVPYVAVNGQLVVDEGKITSARPGKILKGPGYKGAP
jgi:N-acyl-D-aspartate/D-glutamate deacylase